MKTDSGHAALIISAIRSVNNLLPQLYLSSNNLPVLPVDIKMYTKGLCKSEISQTGKSKSERREMFMCHRDMFNISSARILIIRVHVYPGYCTPVPQYWHKYTLT